MAKRLLGMTVYYREDDHLYYPAIITRISPDGNADLVVFGQAFQNSTAQLYGIRQGYGVDRWQSPDLILHDDYGGPIPTNDMSAESPEPAADDPPEPASMFEVSFILFIDGGAADREDVIQAVIKNMEGVGIGRCLRAKVSIDGVAVKAVK